ncbi:MAG TPA: SDR family NAD(P)-dependent oxidoreductase [Bacillota bacterium]|jgi:NAD(P)-dependent dehydrogenase (short-subunit alcohol dehydrogenase family)|nr:SDR family NAD(P)-dependent oxidoreductase [Fastidiosipila sp.]HPX93752.1 SDR family NAD(P)-dependent oxidoreductase [Bacillota bacterium]HQB81577.1 SDR family NAD(P)-dependent oxidoreductase [Bacillota bacterium]
MSSLERVLVTGGSSGIGKALADLLLRGGSHVYSLSRTVLPEESYPKGGMLCQIACDITDERALSQAFEEIRGKTDFLDAVFSNAGFGIAGAIADTPKEEVMRQFDLNFFSSAEVVRHSIPLLREKNGRIILTSSVAAVVSLPYQSFYSATKASLNMLALALNTELKAFGIKTVAVMPGDVATSFPDNRVKDSCLLTEYGEGCERSVARMEDDERTGTEPSAIAAKIIRIAKKKHPKPLYGLGFFYRLVLVLFKLLPVRLTHWIVGRLYG